MIGKSLAANIILGLSVLLIWLTAETSVAESQKPDCTGSLECLNEQFSFEEAPVDIRLIFLLNGHIRQNAPTVSSVNLSSDKNYLLFGQGFAPSTGVDKKGRVTVTMHVAEDTSGLGVLQYSSSSCTPRNCWFSYTHIGTSDSGVHVLQVAEQYGGLRAKPSVLLLKSRKQRMRIRYKNEKHVLLDFVGKLDTGWTYRDRSFGYDADDIILDGNTLTIKIGTVVSINPFNGEQEATVYDLSGY